MSTVLLAKKPRPIVAGEDDIGIAVEAKLFHFVQDAPCIVIDFLDDIAIEASLGFPLELF